jgi:hypothetical protein
MRRSELTTCLRPAVMGREDTGGLLMNPQEREHALLVNGAVT